VLTAGVLTAAGVVLTGAATLGSTFGVLITGAGFEAGLGCSTGAVYTGLDAGFGCSFGSGAVYTGLDCSTGFACAAGALKIGLAIGWSSTGGSYFGVVAVCVAAFPEGVPPWQQQGFLLRRCHGKWSDRFPGQQGLLLWLHPRAYWQQDSG